MQGCPRVGGGQRPGGCYPRVIKVREKQEDNLKEFNMCLAG